jgi:hypothetical protein
MLDPPNYGEVVGDNRSYYEVMVERYNQVYSVK